VTASIHLDKDAAIVASENAAGQYVTIGHIRVPPLIAILIGEAVYNLRAALDYLVYELSILDSGKAAERIQFPLESCDKGWAKRETGWLCGVSDHHKASIKLLQPFNNVIWTTTLRELSNPDKHRHLTVASQGTKVTVSGSGSLKVYANRVTITEPVEVEYQSAATILFQDGSLVIETLNELQSQVAQVIDTFEPDFA
jgi:hypothetical protein